MNKKILDKITITGIDDNVNCDMLQYFSKKYLYLEWGILISKSRVGLSRFPSVSKINEFLNLNLKFSAHICGEFMRNICMGNWEILNYFDFSKFDRIQLNFSREIDKIDKNKFISGLKNINFNGQIILQTQNINHPLIIEASKIYDILPLFDISGGRGIKPLKWPEQFNFNGCGFSGGLNPENIKEELKKISCCVPDYVWIDVESGVRTENKFDFKKVENFLKNTVSWVKM